MDKQIYQSLMIGLRGPELTDAERTYLKDLNPGGVILFTRNCADVGQVASLCREIYQLSEIPPFIAIDEEGGVVRRLRNLFDSLHSISDFARHAPASQIHHFGNLTGRILRSLGINTDLAPVVDLQFNDSDNALRERYWGDEARLVIERAGSFLRGLQQEGVHGCIKHFPGLGRATVDSHYDLPVVRVSRQRLRSVDMVPFKILHTVAPMIMMAHCAFPSITNSLDEPSTIIDYFYRTCREFIGFEGIIIADDLGMKAISKGLGLDDIIRRVVLAGATMLPFCNDFDVIDESFSRYQALYDNDPAVAESLERAAEKVVDIKSSLKLDSNAFEPDLNGYEAARKEMESFARKWN